jgi:transposase-like protein
MNAKVYLTLNGHTKHIREWERVLGISEQVISRRLQKGHSAEDALKPVGHIKRGRPPKNKKGVAHWA